MAEVKKKKRGLELTAVVLSLLLKHQFNQRMRERKEHFLTYVQRRS